jgi:hypothetical protein
MRIGLAFRAFFAALLGRPLPEAVIPRALLPEPPEAPAPAPAPAEQPTPSTPKADLEAAAIETLGLLQREGRLVDFLFEDLEDYGDADIGAAVREVHRGCKKALVEHFDLEPIRAEDEETLVDVASDFDRRAVRLTGDVTGAPPYSGVLRHKGWRATAVRLPRVEPKNRIVAPAEVEVS